MTLKRSRSRSKLSCMLQKVLSFNALCLFYTSPFQPLTTIVMRRFSLRLQCFLRATFKPVRGGGGWSWLLVTVWVLAYSLLTFHVILPGVTFVSVYLSRRSRLRAPCGKLPPLHHDLLPPLSRRPLHLRELALTLVPLFFHVVVRNLPCNNDCYDAICGYVPHFPYPFPACHRLCF